MVKQHDKPGVMANHHDMLMRRAKRGDRGHDVLGAGLVNAVAIFDGNIGPVHGGEVKCLAGTRCR